MLDIIQKRVLFVCGYETNYQSRV